MTSTRTFSWQQLVAEADPEHTRNARINREYEFTGVRGGNPRTHEGSIRYFDGDYQQRGAYSPIELDDGVLTWNGAPFRWQGGQMVWEPSVWMTWNGVPLTWDGVEMVWTPA